MSHTEDTKRKLEKRVSSELDRQSQSVENTDYPMSLVGRWSGRGVVPTNRGFNASAKGNKLLTLNAIWRSRSSSFSLHNRSSFS